MGKPKKEKKSGSKKGKGQKQQGKTARKKKKKKRNRYIGQKLYQKVQCLWMQLKNYFSISNHSTKSFSILSGILLMLKDTAFSFKSIIIMQRILFTSKPKIYSEVIFSVLNPAENMLLV